MTGFGRAEAPLAEGQATIEVRAVNSRHLDVRVKLPRELGALEPELRARASRHFARGQVEVSLRLAPLELVPQVQIDERAARRYAEAAARLVRELGLEGGLSPAALLTLPGVVQLGEADTDLAGLREALLAGTEAACRAAAEMRSREGAEIARDLLSRLERVEAGVGEIEARAEEVHKGVRERLLRRLATLSAEVEADSGRLEQELVYWADRQDISEEIVRLRSHVGQFRETLDRDGPVGRRLEFLLQEIGREVNTLGSKPGDAAVSARVVDLKAELERVREQVLNVE
jgi:uncharacterized protein (TIGR00255 family)